MQVAYLDSFVFDQFIFEDESPVDKKIKVNLTNEFDREGLPSIIDDSDNDIDFIDLSVDDSNTTTASSAVLLTGLPSIPSIPKKPKQRIGPQSDVPAMFFGAIDAGRTPTYEFFT